MGRQALSQGRLGAAIWWGVRSKDAAFTSHLAHQVGWSFTVPSFLPSSFPLTSLFSFMGFDGPWVSPILDNHILPPPCSSFSCLLTHIISRSPLVFQLVSFLLPLYPQLFSRSFIIYLRVAYNICSFIFYICHFLYEFFLFQWTVLAITPPLCPQRPLTCNTGQKKKKKRQQI